MEGFDVAQQIEVQYPDSKDVIIKSCGALPSVERTPQPAAPFKPTIADAATGASLATATATSDDAVSTSPIGLAPAKPVFSFGASNHVNTTAGGSFGSTKGGTLGTAPAKPAFVFGTNNANTAAPMFPGGGSFTFGSAPTANVTATAAPSNFKFNGASGGWKCPTCLATNDLKVSKCSACSQWRADTGISDL